MSDYIIQDGDQAMFLPAFGMATAVPSPGQISASGKSTINGKKICIEGDEASVEVPGVTYFTPIYSIPGTGTLVIDKLSSDQVATKTNDGGTPVILKGSSFTAKLKVQAPAMQPPPGPGSPIPDSATEYAGGQGNFITTNIISKGT